MEQELLDNIGNNIGNILVLIIFALIAGKVITFFLRGILTTTIWVVVAVACIYFAAETTGTGLPLNFTVSYQGEKT